ncbi:spermidine synthase [Neptuniibacter halophilus]|uniref:spermidine synthase n=1 Tax=Neptuniibacter halophilus TaxID=651666 RepID=UPI00257330F5|nr:spermidine synthase [Neptuniibacter halophilus]
MSIPGKEINRSYDEFGPIRIFDDGNKRYLAFGDNDEQSCWLKSEPLVPQHEYSRAMLLSLLFVEPKRALTLGLGSGCINSCLHHHFPGLKQQVVELRPGVIQAAYKYFQFPRSKRLQVINQDAFEFLCCDDSPRVDLVLSDIYSAEGLDEQQLSEQYLNLTENRLKAHGWLVLNCWREHQSGHALELLQTLFTQVWGCNTPCGNWIVFASNAPVQDSSKQLKQRARALSQQLGFSLNSLLNRLKCYTD